MKHVRLLVCLLMATGLAGGNAGAEPVQGGEGVPLLAGQGKDGALAGWRMFSEVPETRISEVWLLGTDGVLVCKGSPNGYLYSEKQYTDFVLTLEWRWPPGGAAGKGGVLLRMNGEHQIWPRSLEAQLNAGAAGDFWALGGFALSGNPERVKTVSHPRFGVLTNLPRLGGAEKPVGEWNSLEIVAKGDAVTIKMNGEEVNRSEGCAVNPGHILLTAEGFEIHFRNLRLSEAK